MSEVQKLVLFLVRMSGAADLRELVEGVRSVLPWLAPGTIHDALNDLIQNGSIVLSNSGVYLPKAAA